MDLFDHASKYPSGPGFAKGSATSREAAERLTARGPLHDFILHELGTRKLLGLTVDQVVPAAENKFLRKFDRSTIAARFTELERAGLIVKTTEKRLTPMRRKAFVYKLPA